MYAPNGADSKKDGELNLDNQKALSLPQLLNSSKIKKRFLEILGKNAQSFISSILSIYNDNEKFRQCDPMSILTAAGQAANLKLPILPQLGYAYVIPYFDARTQKYSAQFQLGYKGLIQLAMRSGLYRNLNTTEIYEGQIKRINYITGEIEIGERTSDTVVGYAAYMELVNGFSKTLYMSRADMERHAQTYSESYRKDKDKRWSVWAKNFDTMAKKTVLKKLLTTFAPTSIEMQDNALSTALKADTPTITSYGELEPQELSATPNDCGGIDIIDNETEEVLSPIPSNQDDTNNPD